MRIKEQPKSVIELLIDCHSIALRNTVFASESGVRCSVNGGTFTKGELRERIGLKQASHLADCARSPASARYQPNRGDYLAKRPAAGTAGVGAGVRTAEPAIQYALHYTESMSIF
jgi:hypothetical protein